MAELNVPLISADVLREDCRWVLRTAEEAKELPENWMPLTETLGPSVTLKMTSVSPISPSLSRSQEANGLSSSLYRATTRRHATLFATGLHGMPARTPVRPSRSLSLILTLPWYVTLMITSL